MSHISSHFEWSEEQVQVIETIIYSGGCTAAWSTVGARRPTNHSRRRLRTWQFFMQPRYDSCMVEYGI